MNTELLNKAQRLALAGAVAPVLRASPHKSRRVAVVNADGEIVGYRTLAEVQEKLLEAKKIELDVDDETRPTVALCRVCSLPTQVKKKGKVVAICPKHFVCRCGARLHRNAYCEEKIRKRHGGPALCGSCSVRESMSKKSPEERARQAQKANACVSREVKLEKAAKMRAARQRNRKKLNP